MAQNYRSDSCIRIMLLYCPIRDAWQLNNDNIYVDEMINFRIVLNQRCSALIDK